MKESVFNALPVVDSPSAALALTVGDYFLFTEDAIQQNNPSAPNSNRVTYLQRISQDKTGIVSGGSSNIELNFTHVSQPVTAGGPYPPSAGGYEVNEYKQGDTIENPSTGNFGNNTGSIPIPFTELNFPDDPFPGQGGVGYVRIFDLLT